MNLTTQRPSAASGPLGARDRPPHPRAAFFPAPPIPGTETPSLRQPGPSIHQSIYPSIHLNHPPPVIHQALPPPDCPITDWINVIREAYALGGANTLALARLVSAARESLRGHGEWNRLWREGLPRVPFSRRKAYMLARIGSALGELSVQNFAHMPSAWTTLYYLAQLGERRVQQLIAAGRIHPEITLQQAKDLLAEFRPGRKRSRPGLLLRLRLARFAAYIETVAPNCSAADRRFARAQLLKVVEILGPPLPPALKAHNTPAPFKHLEIELYPSL